MKSVPWALFALLAFGTSITFIREAWAVQSFQIGAFGLLAVTLVLPNQRLPQQLSPFLFTSVILYCAPLWGLCQLAFALTTSAADTWAAVLRWSALVAVFFLAQCIAPDLRYAVLDGFSWFATALAVLCMTQLFTSEGCVLWLIETAYTEIAGTFLSRNNYAQFVELALPLALFGALRDGRSPWAYTIASGALYASVIASASRAGTVLCTLELITILLIGFQRRREDGTRMVAVTVAAVILIATVFTLIVGWERVWIRFHDKDPFAGRREFLLATLDMAAHRPITGYGLGTFSSVYQRYAVKDFPFYVNEAHNDWAQFAAEGGIPFLLMIFLPFLRATPTALRTIWGIGLVAVVIHAYVDYPFRSLGVSAWLFAMLGIIYAIERESRHIPLHPRL